VAALAVIHLLFLHQSGSSNPLGLSLNKDKVPFHPYFSYKDLIGFVALAAILGALVLTQP
jgi:ubiquinol-cytochrome c reductase cytochrome b subunit